MGLMCLALNLLGLLMMSERKEEKDRSSSINSEMSESLLLKEGVSQTSLMTVKDFLKLKEFYLLVIINSFNFVPSTIFSLNYKVSCFLSKSNGKSAYLCLVVKPVFITLTKG